MYEKLVANLHRKSECYSHEKFKAIFKIWASVKKGT